MPTSLANGKEWTAKIFRSIAHYSEIKRVLDIGPGQGTYTYMKQQGQYWIGVEAWAPYVEKFNLKTKYDEIVIADARYVDYGKFGRFDVTFLGDVLEHMEKKDSIDLVENISFHSRFMILSLPIVKFPQDAVDGNFFEIHVKDDWSHEEVMDSFSNIWLHKVDGPIGVYCAAARGGDAKLLRSFAQVLGQVEK